MDLSKNGKPRLKAYHRAKACGIVLLGAYVLLAMIGPRQLRLPRAYSLVFDWNLFGGFMTRSVTGYRIVLHVSGGERLAEPLDLMVLVSGFPREQRFRIRRLVDALGKVSGRGEAEAALLESLGRELSSLRPVEGEIREAEYDPLEYLKNWRVRRERPIGAVTL